MSQSTPMIAPRVTAIVAVSEDAPAAFDEFGGDVELGFDCIRQTGGLGRVVSLYAILNRNVHVGPLIRRSSFAQTFPRSSIQ